MIRTISFTDTAFVVGGNDTNPTPNGSGTCVCTQKGGAVTKPWPGLAACALSCCADRQAYTNWVACFYNDPSPAQCLTGAC